MVHSPVPGRGLVFEEVVVELELVFVHSPVLEPGLVPEEVVVESEVAGSHFDGLASLPGLGQRRDLIAEAMNGVAELAGMSTVVLEVSYLDLEH